LLKKNQLISKLRWSDLCSSFLVLENHRLFLADPIDPTDFLQFFMLLLNIVIALLLL